MIVRLLKIVLLTLSTILTMTCQRWIYAETAVVASQSPSDYTDAEQSDLRYLQQNLYAIIGGPAIRRSAVVKHAPVQNAIPWRSRLTDGFFHERSNVRRPLARRRVTNRPKDIIANVTRNGSGDVGSGPAAIPSTTKSTVGTRLLFSSEEECVSANGGRACVCYMTDFLDLVGQRLDEAAEDDETVEFRCQSFKPVPVAFVVYPLPPSAVEGTSASATVLAKTVAAAVPRDPVVMVVRNGDKRGARAHGRCTRPFSRASRLSRVLARPGDGNKSVTTTSWKEVDFDEVVNYRLEKPKDDHYAVQYGLVGSDAKVKCLINGNGNGTKMIAFKWDFKKSKLKTNSTVTGTDSNVLLILGLDSADSKNYTCTPTTDVASGSKNSTSYKHYVVAVEKAIYEIRGSAFYKTRGGGGCTNEIIIPTQKQLPISVRTELCPEGSSRYACNVIVEKPKCSEDERTMEIKYLVTLNDKANYLTRIKTSRKGRIALRYQKLLARISNILASNLNKTLTVQITSKLSLIDTQFEADNSRKSIKNFVSCAPGFGIREVFCAACPPHHYSPDKSSECLKCAKGFHQPVAGSEKCVKCRNMFASGCYMREFQPKAYYWMGLICLLVILLVAIPCVFCCRDENEQSRIKILPKKIRKKFKKSKNQSLPSSTETEDTQGTRGSSAINKSNGKIKNLSKSKKKLKTVDSKIPFDNVHEKFGQRLQVEQVSEVKNLTI